ncbi:hypothetical protein PC129_g3297 [Phytophthora cactorum]|uniref:RxLR effector PexRD54 WY domain-containing protein n=1 Tax=Phytophthora cactorum TaxID=29920 RepID=A0A329SHC0_9STRA|nr:hypothetical protein GQ600_5452 [Phytophthora cactorum]KAG2772257.1 hypothetical protein Pcac1_g16890 [Phytophthora cactorum]KAG2840029.1 hypothetical protein PC112_g3882 [Phytophthora cactorum]KAG2840677.1 hypothetical protein PC111_g3394 [Phytophthora cactorum]KAG2866241.1 hypothetical protein PC113_g3011 [Phytophthora cactorum]
MYESLSLASTERRASSSRVSKVGQLCRSFMRLPHIKRGASVTKAYKKNPGMGRSAMFSTLIAHYGDETLTRLLVEAHQVSKTKNIAQQLEIIQLDNWLTQKTTADDVYSLLKLNANEGNLLQNPLLNTWISYIQKVGEGNPFNSVLLKLAKRYDEDGLAHILSGAKAADNTQNIAKKVERAQLVNWLSNGKTVDDAITLLRLNTGEGGELLKNPALSTWFSYVKMTKQNPDELLFLKLKTRFSDEELVTMIAVTRDAKVWIYLEGLARVQLKNWLRKDKTADDIFNVLKLNKEGDTLFESPKISFATRVDNDNPDELMYSVMTKYYGNERLETMFARAKDSATTTSLASKLEQEMWMS